MLSREIIAVCNEYSTKDSLTLCGYNAWFVIAEANGTYGYHRLVDQQSVRRLCLAVAHNGDHLGKIY
jgi:hypothetical protein